MLKSKSHRLAIKFFNQKHIHMKKQICYLLVATLSTGLFFASCKKSDSNNSSSTDTEAQVQSDDQARFSNETDAVANDANAALENSGTSYSERPSVPPLAKACDFTVAVDTISSPRTITITYSGNCLGDRSRSGVVILSFQPGFRWRNPGASYTITYQNVKITRGRDNKSITLNGVKTITNISGGTLRNLSLSTTPVVHEVKSTGMSITFDDGSQRTWQLAKRRTFTYDNGIVISIAGISTEGEGIAEWGTNRFGKPFTCTYLQPLVIKQGCGFRLVSGQVKHTNAERTTTTTFGLDASGNPVSSCPAGSFYFKIQWVAVNGNAYSFIGPY